MRSPRQDEDNGKEWRYWREFAQVATRNLLLNLKQHNFVSGKSLIESYPYKPSCDTQVDSRTYWKSMTRDRDKKTGDRTVKRAERIFFLLIYLLCIHIFFVSGWSSWKLARYIWKRSYLALWRLSQQSERGRVCVQGAKTLRHNRDMARAHAGTHQLNHVAGQHQANRVIEKVVHYTERRLWWEETMTTKEYEWNGVEHYFKNVT